MWCRIAWPSTRSKLSSANGSRSASAGTVRTFKPERSALAARRREHARRDVAAGGLVDQAGAHHVQREVAGPRADLQRPRVVAGLAAERLAHLGEHLVVAELAEVDPPLGVVVIGRHVVVAGVYVADLLCVESRWHGSAPYTRAPCLCASPQRAISRPSTTSVTATLYEQRDQPEGVPPLALTGERTLPDVPEENYWFRRHLAVYEWIAARVAGERVIDMACGEGYGSDVLAAQRRERGRRRRQPRGARARAAALPPPEPALRARPGRELRRAGRRGRVPADDRAPAGPGRGARALPLARRASGGRCTCRRRTC